ncbi:MAG: hypothetical protein Q9227_002037 [Pyrenula ochraceoflavens]
MPKRKRDAIESNSSLTKDTDHTSVYVDHLRAHVVKSTKALHDALKLARGFERQKLGRRIKAALATEKVDGSPHRLNEEVKALKSLDLNVTAERYLWRSMRKAKKLRETDAVQRLEAEMVGEGEITPKPGAEANVCGRLFKSNVVRKVMDEMMAGVYQLLGLEQGNARIGAVNGFKNVSKSSKSLTGPENPANQDYNNTKEKVLETQNGSFDHSKGDTSAESPELEHGDREALEESDDNLDLKQFTHRLASSDSENDSDPDLGPSSEQLESRTQSHPSLQRRYSLSISPSPSPSLSPQAFTRPPPPPSTTFIPSLSLATHGYISGGSSSEGTPDRDFDPLQASKPKNRRGQRERRMINEKKYGKNARHLQGAGAGKGRDEGWDTRAGAVSVENGRGRGRGSWRGGREGGARDHSGYERNKNSGHTGRRKPEGPGKDSSLMRISTRGGAARTNRRHDNEGPLHPSWEAAKKRKQDSSKAGAPYQGKKVVFD